MISKPLLSLSVSCIALSLTATLSGTALAQSAEELSDDIVLDTLLQNAAERAYQRHLTSVIATPKRPNARPAVQAAFCIDVRSEVFRRAFEAQSTEIETIGFGVDNDFVSFARSLYQTKLWPIGGFSVEFGIDAQKSAFGELLAGR